MKKRYLKTVEEVIALKDTDTKIYKEHATWYYKFVKGVLCRFSTYNGITYFNCTLNIEKDIYILEEEPEQEATEKDIGMLCRFWGRDYKDAELGILEEVSYDGYEVKYMSKDGYWYYHCHKLTPSEVAELTGYKVEEAE